MNVKRQNKGKACDIKFALPKKGLKKVWVERLHTANTFLLYKLYSMKRKKRKKMKKRDNSKSCCIISSFHKRAVSPFHGFFFCFFILIFLSQFRTTEHTMRVCMFHTHSITHPKNTQKKTKKNQKKHAKKWKRKQNAVFCMIVADNVFYFRQ